MSSVPTASLIRCSGIELLSRRFRRKSARHLRGGLTPQLGRDETTGHRERLEIDAGADAEAIQEIEHVLARDIAGCTLRIGTAAEPRDRAVRDGDAELQ